MTFSAASRRVVRRLVLVRWLRLLGRSAPAVCLAAGAWLCRPSPVAALARWDEAAGRHEMFTSALCFEQTAAPEEGERLHLAVARERLPSELPALARHLPARLAPRAWALPLLLLGFMAAVPASAPTEAGALLDEEALAAVREVSAALGRRAEVPGGIQGLTPAERKEIEKLEAAVRQTADNLRTLEGGSQRDVLSELEQRAHEAERLAESLAGDADDPVSSKLIAELERHADTAGFASALRAQDMEKSAAEADKLAGRLEHKDLTLEERKRVENALDKALAAADAKEKEKERLLSKKLQEAHKELEAGQPREAARPFGQLARHYAQAGQRKAAQKQLQQLAGQLRSAGQQMFGQQTGAIRRLAQANAASPELPAGTRQLGPQSLAQGNAAMEQWAGLRPGPTGPPPGAAQLAMAGPNPSANTPGVPMHGTPAPGAHPNAAPAPGAGQAPVPGAGNAPGQGAGAGTGAAPVPGTSAGPSPAGGSPGGLHAGRGTAPLGGDATKPLDGFQARFRRLVREMQRAIVGYEPLISDVLVAVFSQGHVLLEGAPGLGKTYLVNVLSRVLGLTSGRVQCTPDLMPADILGTHIIGEDESGRRVFRFEKGPVFHHLLLVDEINRATPKTQAALLETMQERAVTAGGERFLLPAPFFVLATQNPLEMEGTYPLPEAQLDRFFFKLRVPFPAAEELLTHVPVAEPLLMYAARLVLASHPAGAGAGGKTDGDVARFVAYGASPRGTQAIVRAARAYCLLEGRTAASVEDVRRAALPALRHRLILNFEGEGEQVNVDDLIGHILKTVPTPANGAE